MNNNSSWRGMLYIPQERDHSYLNWKKKCASCFKRRLYQCLVYNCGMLCSKSINPRYPVYCFSLFLPLEALFWSWTLFCLCCTHAHKHTHMWGITIHTPVDCFMLLRWEFAAKLCLEIQYVYLRARKDSKLEIMDLNNAWLKYYRNQLSGNIRMCVDETNLT